jgi:ribosomal protein L11 methyltransferase
MFIRLPSGFKISIPPVFFWESRGADLEIRCKSAFYPDHVTSRLCLELLDEHLRSTECRTVLDIGCGSGVLALTAARLGVPFAAGLDIDQRAAAVSRENALQNGLGAKTHWLVGTTSAVRGLFDCVMANLPYHVLCRLFDDMVRLIEPGGSLILSGFHDIQWDAVRALLISRGLEKKSMRSGDLSFCGEPPSGSYTWMAVLAGRTACRGATRSGGIGGFCEESL